MLTWWRWRLHLFLSGLALIAVGLLLPAPEMRVAEPRSRLDQIAPAWQFNEVHSITVAAPCAKTWTAVKEVTAGEIKLFHALTWIRRLADLAREHPQRAGDDADPRGRNPNRLSAVGGGSRARDRDRRDTHPPDRAKAFMNFQLTESGTGSCEVTTETRVHTTDASAGRRFARYWRVIYPGSALIRRMWLRAVRDRAESS